MKKYYKDFTGTTASVSKYGGQYRLKMCDRYGNYFCNRLLKSELACKQVMTRYNGFPMEEVKPNKN